MKHICKHCRADVCEFCESSYNESKTGQCYLCECGREGRSHPDVESMREACKKFGSTLRDIGLSERKMP